MGSSNRLHLRAKETISQNRQPPKRSLIAVTNFGGFVPTLPKVCGGEEIIYAKYMFDQVAREQLMKMLTWYIGVKTQFSRNPGKFGKYFQQYLEPELWKMLQKSYADSSYDEYLGSLIHNV